MRRLIITSTLSIKDQKTSPFNSRSLRFLNTSEPILTATLAQIYLAENNVKSATVLFNEAYEKLERSGDLSKGSEVGLKSIY